MPKLENKFVKIECKCGWSTYVNPKRIIAVTCGKCGTKHQIKAPKIVPKPAEEPKKVEVPIITEEPKVPIITEKPKIPEEPKKIKKEFRKPRKKATKYGSKKSKDIG